jgi:hypothetical protein
MMWFCYILNRVGTKVFDFVVFAKVFAKFTFRFREKILAKVFTKT